MSEQIHDIPVLQVKGEGAPRAFVFTSQPKHLTPAEAKRARFVHNLKESYRRFKETLEAMEHFAAVCELSPERVLEIRRAKEAALDELSLKFEEKLKAYDARIGGGS